MKLPLMISLVLFLFTVAGAVHIYKAIGRSKMVRPVDRKRKKAKGVKTFKDGLYTLNALRGTVALSLLFMSDFLYGMYKYWDETPPLLLGIIMLIVTLTTITYSSIYIGRAFKIRGT